MYIVILFGTDICFSVTLSIFKLLLVESTDATSIVTESKLYYSLDLSTWIVISSPPSALSASLRVLLETVLSTAVGRSERDLLLGHVNQYQLSLPSVSAFLSYQRESWTWACILNVFLTVKNKFAAILIEYIFLRNNSNVGDVCQTRCLILTNW